MWWQVTAEERKIAAATIGGKTAQLTVAFGKRAPAYDPAWNVKVSSIRLELMGLALCYPAHADAEA